MRLEIAETKFELFSLARQSGDLRFQPRFLGFLVSLALLIAAVPCSATTVGYWRFEEGPADAIASGPGSVLDQTANNNHGTPVSDPFYRSAVPADPVPLTAATNNLSLELNELSDVGDYVSIPHSASLNVLDNFTVEFWMKADSGSQLESLYLVVDKSHGWTDSTGWLFQGSSSSGSLSFGIGNGGGGSTNFAIATSTSSLTDGDWHHVAGTFNSTDDGQEIKIYVDGFLENSAPSGAYASNTRAINVGASWGGGSFRRYFDGSVDELRISNAVLTPDQFLNAVPLPAALPLLLCALAGLGFVKRKARI